MQSFKVKHDAIIRRDSRHLRGGRRAAPRRDAARRNFLSYGHGPTPNRASATFRFLSAEKFALRDVRFRLVSSHCCATATYAPPPLHGCLYYRLFGTLVKVNATWQIISLRPGQLVLNATEIMIGGCSFNARNKKGRDPGFSINFQPKCRSIRVNSFGCFGGNVRCWIIDSRVVFVAFVH